MTKWLSLVRLPYPEDKLFGVAVLLFISVPLLFTFYTYENFETIKFALWLILFGISSVGWLKKKPGFFFKDTKFFLLIFAFIFAGVLSTLFSVDWLNSLVGFYYRFTNGLVFYILWGLTLLGFLQIEGQDKRWFLIKVLNLVSLIVAIFGLLQSVQIGYYANVDAGLLRGPGFLGNPNFSSMFIVMILPFTFGLAYLSRNFKERAFYGFSGLLMVLGIAVFSSRAAIIALFVEVVLAIIIALVFNFNQKFKKFLILGTGVCLILLILVLKTVRPEAFFGSLGFADSNVTLRLALWEISFQGFLTHPWLGFGLGNFQIFFENFRPQFLAGEFGIFDDAHNLFIHMAVTGGAALLLSFMGLIGTALWRGVTYIRAEFDNFSFCNLLALIGFIVAACFNPVAIPCFLVLGFILSNLSKPVKQEFKSQNFLVKMLFSFFGIIFLYFGFALIFAEHFFAFAYRNFVFGQEYLKAKKFSKIAMFLNPTNQLYHLYRVGSIIKSSEFDVKLSLSEIQDFQKIHNISARDNIYVANLYYLLYTKTQNVEYLKLAVKYIEESIKKDVYFGERYGKLALYFFILNDFPKALENLKQSIVWSPRHLPTWVLMAKIYQLQNEKEKMLFALKQAYEINPFIPEIKHAFLVVKHTENLSLVPLEVRVWEGRLE